VIDATGAGSVSAVQNFYRLFMMPGVGHCATPADVGPDNIGVPRTRLQFLLIHNHDIVSALETWVEQGVAPANFDRD